MNATLFIMTNEAKDEMERPRKGRKDICKSSIYGDTENNGQGCTVFPGGNVNGR
jgi:hypothetical protein